MGKICNGCGGTGDPVNHEREINICSQCEGSGVLCEILLNGIPTTFNQKEVVCKDINKKLGYGQNTVLSICYEDKLNHNSGILYGNFILKLTPSMTISGFLTNNA